jgi:hypothetical protein
VFQAKQDSHDQKRRKTKMEGIIDFGEDLFSRQAQPHQAQNDNKEGK